MFYSRKKLKEERRKKKRFFSEGMRTPKSAPKQMEKTPAAILRPVSDIYGSPPAMSDKEAERLLKCMLENYDRMHVGLRLHNHDAIRPSSLEEFYSLERDISDGVFGEEIQANKIKWQVALYAAAPVEAQFKDTTEGMASKLKINEIRNTKEHRSSGSTSPETAIAEAQQWAANAATIAAEAAALSASHSKTPQQKKHQHRERDRELDRVPKQSDQSEIGSTSLDDENDDFLKPSPLSPSEMGIQITSEDKLAQTGRFFGLDVGRSAKAEKLEGIMEDEVSLELSCHKTREKKLELREECDTKNSDTVLDGMLSLLEERIRRELVDTTQTRNDLMKIHKFGMKSASSPDEKSSKATNHLIEKAAEPYIGSPADAPEKRASRVFSKLLDPLEFATSTEAGAAKRAGVSFVYSIKLKPFGVLGVGIDITGRINIHAGADPISMPSVCFCDPAKLENLYPPAWPKTADGLSGDIYKYLGISENEFFDSEVLASLREDGDAKYKRYSKGATVGLNKRQCQEMTILYLFLSMHNNRRLQASLRALNIEPFLYAHQRIIHPQRLLLLMCT